MEQDDAALGAAVRDPQRARCHGDEARRAIGVAELDLVIVGQVTEDRGSQLPGAPRKHGHRLVDQRGRRVPEQAFDGGVRVLDEAARVDGEHRDGRTLEDGGQELGGLAQLAVARRALRERAHDADEQRHARIDGRDANAVDFDRHAQPVTTEQLGRRTMDLPVACEAAANLVELCDIGEVVVAGEAGLPARASVEVVLAA